MVNKGKSWQALSQIQRLDVTNQKWPSCNNEI